MSLQYNIVLCTLCNRDFKRYDAKENKRIFGLNLARSKNYNLTITFDSIEKSTMNKHICTQCIDDIINKFSQNNY